MKVLRGIAFVGDGIYILWMLYNGIDEGFRYVNSVQGIASIGLIFLLIVNLILLFPRQN